MILNMRFCEMESEHASRGHHNSSVYDLFYFIIFFFVEAAGYQNTSKVIYPFVSSGNFEKEITSSGLGYKILASLAVVSRKLFLFAKQAG